MKTTHTDRTAAFTLIELLVVVAIIAVLAAIVIPAAGSVRAKGDAVACTSNLRQLGAAIAAYASDHDGSLPGPLAVAQYAPSSQQEKPRPGALAPLIAKYAGITQPKDSTPAPGSSIFYCPAHHRAVRGSTDAAVFFMNFRDTMTARGDQVPWGDVDAAIEPVQMSALSEWTELLEVSRASEPEPKSLSRTWAMIDADREALKDATVENSDSLPAHPVHGDARNALYYDWHVDRLPVEGFAGIVKKGKSNY